MRRHTLMRVLGGILAVLVLACAGLFYYVYKIVGDRHVEYSSEENQAIVSSISEEAKAKTGGVKNFAVFGVDTRGTTYENTRSDVVMIVSVDEANGKMTLTSVPRDCYVEIPGHGLDKMTHAYAYGGAALAIQTLNRNFDLNITEYVTMNFWAVESIIDSIGGVEVNVKDYEVKELNVTISELNSKAPSTSVQSVAGISGAGQQTLNGRQAVAYMRIRMVGNGDYERMERQRTVMIQAFNEVKNLGVTKLASVAEKCLPNVQTSLSFTEILSMGKSALAGMKNIEQSQLPLTDDGSGKMINKVWYFVPKDLTGSVEKWHSEIYGTPYTASKTVKNIASQY
ncbi:LCP family protein [Gehongia tenuis]|uniref:LCP family protein n=1 Tax=Gehongia tenuis TaxID=2763655 RepID=A0A926D4I7_9FIRM|nr:LCP family protein [Gehongia tenuis]MBC8531207.1 LCP family protein [Gehongia tenuis]